jgi:hypothetical protein
VRRIGQYPDRADSLIPLADGAITASVRRCMDGAAIVGSIKVDVSAELVAIDLSLIAIA